MSRLEGKIALITGAARGIGAETARLFVQEGAIVIIADVLRDEGFRLAEDIKAVFEPINVAEESEWRLLAEKIHKRWGRLDVLFNNAGIIGLENGAAHDPEHTELSEWQHVHRVNLDSVFLGCKYGIALMKQHGGSIINMSSRSGIVGIPAAAAYASSKAAVRNHTKTVALYCASMGYRIRCNSLHPGAILTPLWDPMLGSGDERQKNIEAIGAGVPLGHMGEPLDVAYAALYLASEESKYVTGIELTLDGGILAGSAAAPQKR